MKKLFSTFFLFIAIALIVYYLVNVFFVARRIYFPNNLYVSGAKSGSILRYAEADTVKDVDILILGSSHAANGYDPRIFKEKYDKNIFILANPALSSSLGYFILNKYLDNLNPKLVVIDVFDECTISALKTETALDYIANENLSLSELLLVLSLRPTVTVFNASLYSFWDQKKTDITRPVFLDEAKDYVSGGYGSIPFTIDTSKYKLEDSVFVEQSAVERYFFRKTTALLEARGIQYILLQAPVIHPVYKAIVNKDDFNSFFAENGTYYNFNAPKFQGMFTLEDFGDPRHLNQQGVDKFNNYIINNILKK